MELIARYGRVLKESWSAREKLSARERTPLERQFLPAALELIETPAPALPRAIVWTIVAAVSFTLIWAFVGEIDVVAVATGKVIAADKTKVVQPPETAIVKRILVADGEHVKAGQVLVELEAAATATAADTAKNSEALMRARLESARYDALAKNARALHVPSLTEPRGASKSLIHAERRAMQAQYQEHRVKLAAADAEIARRTAELASVERLVAKLASTVPIAQRRAQDYRNLVAQNFVSKHGYLEHEQVRLEQEGDLAFQQAKAKELSAAVFEAQERREALIAEFERGAVDAKSDADKRTAALEQELVKARTREQQQTLIAPVDGTVQQLAIHTVGGVVTPAQVLRVVTPADYLAEIEATLENRDVGFVSLNQHVEVKVETFPFTRYGTLNGRVTFVSQDAVADEKKGLLFQVHVMLEKASLRVDDREVLLTPGMAVTAEIAIGRRRVIEFFLDPIRKIANQGLKER